MKTKLENNLVLRGEEETAVGRKATSNRATVGGEADRAVRHRGRSGLRLRAVLSAGPVAGRAALPGHRKTLLVDRRLRGNPVDDVRGAGGEDVNAERVSDELRASGDLTAVLEVRLGLGQRARLSVGRCVILVPTLARLTDASREEHDLLLGDETSRLIRISCEVDLRVQGLVENRLGDVLVGEEGIHSGLSGTGVLEHGNSCCCSVDKVTRKCL